jgi:arylsulfatase A-like enzyme
MPEGIEGKSLLPFIMGKATKVRDLCYTAYQNSQRSVRDLRWKLIRYPQVNQTQLFDLKNDPHELNNLADKPEYAEKIAEMTTWLETEMARYGDSVSLKVANPKSAAWTPPAGNKRKQPKNEDLAD